MASVADVVIVPLQDVLGAGTEARMNLPGRLGGNWHWRFREGAVTPETRIPCSRDVEGGKGQERTILRERGRTRRLGNNSRC
jgi:hypothetical protein